MESLLVLCQRRRDGVRIYGVAREPPTSAINRARSELLTNDLLLPQNEPVQVHLPRHRRPLLSLLQAQARRQQPEVHPRRRKAQR